MTDDWLQYAPEELDDGFSIEEFLDDLDDLDEPEPQWIPLPAPIPRSTVRWWHEGSCVNVGWDVMSNPLMVESARAVCAGCPVAETCLRGALDTEECYGVWAGTTQEERTRLCPICLGPKEPEALGCNFGHTLLRLGRLTELEEMGTLDVRVSIRQKPSARTNPDCPQPRGRSHNTAAAHKEGCRCDQSIAALREERRGHRGDTGRTRSAYRRKAAS